MSKLHKVTSPLDIELIPIQYMEVSDSIADVWLRKNIRTESILVNTNDSSFEQEFNVADEIYFQVNPTNTKLVDIQENFEKFWIYGENWENQTCLSDADKIARLEEENAKLNKCIGELCNLL